MFTSLFSNNIWNSLTAFYPVLGGVQASHAINAKNPGTNNLSFSGGWTHNASGMTPNGTTGYADTGVNDSTLTNFRHISVYSRTNTLGEFCDIGTLAPSTFGSYMFLRFTDGASQIGCKGVMGIDPSAIRNFANTSSTGFYITSRDTAINKQIWKNGTLSNTQSNSVGSANLSIYIGAINYNGAPAYYSNRQLCFASVGGQINSVATTFSSIINTYQTALGRNTY
jgi:hypothetical protein